MDLQKTEKRRAFIINILYFSIIVLMVHFGVKYVLSWIMPFIIGFSIAYILKPVINKLYEKTKKVPKKLIASLMVILFYLVIISLITFAGWQLIDFISKWVIKLPATYTNVIEPAIQGATSTTNGLINRFFPDLGEDLIKQSSDWLSYLKGAIETVTIAVASGAGSVGKNIPGIITTFIFAILSSVFITIDYQIVVNGMLSIFPQKIVDGIFKFKHYLTDTAFKYFKAVLILMSITFLELVAGLFLINIFTGKVENLIVIAILIAITDMLPVLGVGTILLPWAAVELIKGNYIRALAFLILYVTIFVVRQIVEPKVMSQQLGIHPVLTLLCVYLGFKWMGFMGIIILLISTIIFLNFIKSGENLFNTEKDTK